MTQFPEYTAPPAQSRTSSPEPYPYAPGDPLGESEERTIATLTHVSAIFFPLLGPLVAYVVFRGRSRLVDHHAKEQLNLAISLFVYSLAAIAIAIGTLGLGLLVIIPLCVVAPIAAFLVSIVGAISASNGRYYTFPFILRLVR